MAQTVVKVSINVGFPASEAMDDGLLAPGAMRAVLALRNQSGPLADASMLPYLELVSCGGCARALAQRRRAGALPGAPS